ncbi:UDP-glucose/GDP-mannose dehydrogenase family protein [Candidatus Roizmanbacteria bacterium]|nr:UDP-glucose/GDP-mannose dehydrogenase family protein [Candidatus Roizmanbacteria bacterium]
MTITIVGHGYVGLVTAAVFADLGNTVWVIGRNKQKIAKLKSGDPLFYEPGLSEMMQRNLNAGRLKFTLEYHDAISTSAIVFIGVGTPPKKDGSADLSNVLAVAESIGNHIKNYIVVACKSTVPVGTNRRIKDIILKKSKVPSSKFDVASCPEFLREGSALSDTLHPDRVVIGSETKKAQGVLLEFHEAIDGERVLTTIESAEMIKYASNSLLATKISFANMIAFLCDKVGADVEQVLQGVGLDRRLGRSFLYPGVGYGGSCLPKDVNALIKTGEQYGESMDLLKEVEHINQQSRERLIGKVSAVLNKMKTKKTVAILGLAFKPDTDDLREAPSLKVISSLLSKYPDARIQVFDPIVKQEDHPLFKNVIYSENAYKAANEADVLVVLTEWNEFRKLNLEKIKKVMRGTHIIDGRNIYEPNTVKKMGFSYQGVGRN